MAQAKKKATDVSTEIEDAIVNAEASEAVEAKEQAHGSSENDSETRAAEAQVAADTATAKAGKRSAKGIAEAEAKAEKVERQEHRAEAEAEEAAKPKQPVTPTRSRLERRSKGYRKAAEAVEKGKVYSLKEALELATKTSSVKFDASVELHVNLGVDPRQADQNIRANLVLPQGTGRTIRVAVFSDDTVDGADLSGLETITKDLEKGAINFDILIATPANMAKLGKYARLLGPRGLMPNPKSGTVTNDVTKAVAEAKAGRVEYRVDSTGIVHLSVGKVSFGGARLLENAQAVMANIRAAKPASVKGNYIKAIHVTTTMGPSITVATTE
ncbi:MAG TPA: 50S ribosomal protein L1 [Candidatus Saccharimonadales bacterium]|nr:50S ribosomal protein L1 [Candidatus Saccharimonadales bacterium]